MRVFVAGATGVVGHRAVRQLVAAGHTVSGVARSPEKAELLLRLSVTPVEVDLFDRLAVADAVVGHDAVVNLATNIPPPHQAARAKAWATNDRLRREVSGHLVGAALSAGAARFVQESITFPYVDGGSDWIDEEQQRDVPAMTASVDDAEAAAARFTRRGGHGVVLRFGAFYAPESDQTTMSRRLIDRRVAPLTGRPTAYRSMVHADDAAAAVVAALIAPAGVFNVVDDEPLPNEELVKVWAEVQGRKPPRFPPRALTALGGAAARMLARSQRVSNRRFRDVTGWQPRFPSMADGWPSVVAAMDALAAGGPLVDLTQAATGGTPREDPADESGADPSLGAPTDGSEPSDLASRGDTSVGPSAGAEDGRGPASSSSAGVDDRRSGGRDAVGEG